MWHRKQLSLLEQSSSQDLTVIVMDKLVVGNSLLQEIKYELIRQDTKQAETSESSSTHHRNSHLLALLSGPLYFLQQSATHWKVNMKLLMMFPQFPADN